MTTDHYKSTANNLRKKLPAQHWILRYGALLSLILVALLILGLNCIKIPKYIFLEIQSSPNEQTLTAVTKGTPSFQQWINDKKKFSLLLENGETIQVNYLYQQQIEEQVHLKLSINTKDNKGFLDREGISIARIFIEEQALLSSLWTNS